MAPSPRSARQGAGPPILSRAAVGAVALLALLIGAWLVEPGSQSRTVIALAAASALLWPALGTARCERWRTRALVGLALGSSVLAISERLPAFLTTSEIRVWNVYHYYVGAKYFRELGYTDLYAATLEADRLADDYWTDIERVRDLATYEVVDRDEVRYDAPGTFTERRWLDFQADVQALAPQRSPRSWRGIFVDRGYNATPFWTAVGGALAHLAPATRPTALKLLSSLDLPLLAVTFWLLYGTFGARAAATVLLLLTISPVNVDRFVGGFLQYDWFCAVAIGACFYQRRRPIASAGAFSYAVLTRVFPLFFLLAAALPVARYVIRFRRLSRRHLRFAAALAVWSVAGLAVSLGNGRGPDAWSEFTAAIETHREHHLYGQRRVGLQHLFTHDLSSPSLDESSAERRAQARRQRPLYLGFAFLLISAFALVAWRQRSFKALWLGLVPIFALLVTSRYYWSYLALLPLAGGRRGSPGVRSRWLGGLQAAGFGAFYLFQSRDHGPYADYIVLGLVIALNLAFALAALAPVASKRTTSWPEGPAHEKGRPEGRPRSTLTRRH